MASDITIYGLRSERFGCERSTVTGALGVFASVDATCTRFNASSPLMKANAHPDRWHRVPPVLFQAVVAAHRAHQQTRGWFDPRVLGDLIRLGYDWSLPFGDGEVVTAGRAVVRRQLGSWRPRFHGGRHPEMHLGGLPIDLGGIGKGLAVRWAAEQLDGAIDSYLIDAGGDCVCRGWGPEGDGWRIGIEDPRGGQGPIAVLELRDMACATSSIRVRHWRSGERTVHHLVDPRTGSPGGSGLIAVTVVATDPADAEVLSKTLFLHGRDGIAGAAARRNAAAMWVDAGGGIGETRRLSHHVLWRAA